MNVPKNIGFLLIAVLIPFVQAGSAFGLDIVKDGKPLAKIVIPDNADASTTNAAVWIQKYVKTVSGAELPIFPESNEQSSASPRLCIGATKAAKDAGISAASLKWDGCRLAVKGDSRGKGLIVECSRRKMGYRFYENTVVWRTNHYLFEELSDEKDASRMEEIALQSSRARYDRLSSLVQSPGKMAVSNLEAIARDTRGDFPICNITDKLPWRTLSAWIHVLEKGNPSGSFSWICNTPPVQGTFQKIGWASRPECCPRPNPACSKMNETKANK